MRRQSPAAHAAFPSWTSCRSSPSRSAPAAYRSRQEARDLAERLETEGYKPLRHSQYLIVGTASHEDAEALATRLHGEVEAGGEVVLEAMPKTPSPFALFGGLAQ